VTVRSRVQVLVPASCRNAGQGKAAYKKTQVIGLFPGPYASGSYMHRAALFIDAEAEANTMISAHATLQKHG